MRTRTWGALAGLLLLAGSAVPLSAQEPPEAVGRRFLDTMQAADWPANAALMHPEATESFRRLFAAIAAAGDDETVRELLGMSAAELETMEGARFYERFMRHFVGEVSGLQQAFAGMRAEVLGHVAEGAELAHVVYRMQMEVEGVQVSKVAVIPLKRHGAEWRVLLTGDLENLAAALRAEVQ